MDVTVGRKLSLPRSASLSDRQRITELFKSAKRRSGHRLTVFFELTRAENSVDQFKVLVAIPRKVGVAARRNRIRRMLRETIRLWPDRFNLAGELIVRYNQRPRPAVAATTEEKESRSGSRFESENLRTELIEILEWIRLNTTAQTQ